MFIVLGIALHTCALVYLELVLGVGIFNYFLILVVSALPNFLCYSAVPFILKKNLKFF